MKYLKYLVISMVALFFIPKGVSATQTVDYKEFKVGDEITVWLDAAKTKSAKFRVIENTAAGRETKQPDGEITPNKKAAYQWVTAVYQGTVGESAYGVASEDDLKYETSLLRPNLVVATKNWKTPEDIRLLTLTDLASLAGNADPHYISTHLKTKYPWMVLDKSYWLGNDAFVDQVQVMEGNSITTREVIVAWGVNTQGVVSGIDENTKLGIRPVITIHKGFVEGGMICTCEDCDIPEPKFCPNKPSISIQGCIDSGKSEEVCIEELCKDKTTPKVCPNDPKISIQDCIDTGKSEEICIKEKCTPEKPDNPKTGTYISIGILICSIVAGFVYFLINKKKYFTKI